VSVSICAYLISFTNARAIGEMKIMSAFHIHIDAVNISPAFEEYLTKELRFWRSDFSGSPDSANAFFPVNHFTHKPETSKDFRTAFDRLLTYVKTQDAMKGYIEGEFIAVQKHIEEKPFDSSVSAPFKLNRTRLAPGTFRESELHITLNKDRSNPALIRSLVDMGLFSAYIPKPYGTAQIFTAQGSRTHVQLIVQSLSEYLDNAGGAVDCNLKEERIADWWVSEPNLQLPPVIGSIEWAAQ
jgi:hypothetical protein